MKRKSVNKSNVKERFMSAGLKLNAVGKRDVNGEDYYFTRPRLPVLVDLSKVVIFMHPWEDEETGKFGTEIVFKEYTGPNNSGRQENDRDSKPHSLAYSE